MDVIPCYKYNVAIFVFNILSLVCFFAPIFVMQRQHTWTSLICSILASIGNPLFSIILPWAIFALEKKKSNCCAEEEIGYLALTVCYLFSSVFYSVSIITLCISMGKKRGD